MTRVLVYGGLLLAIAAGAWWFWSATHPDSVLARARTEQAERLQVDPPPRADDPAEDDPRVAERLRSLAALQTQLAGVVQSYCAQHRAMPARVDELALPQVPGMFGIERVDIDGAAIVYALSATEIYAAGRVRYVPSPDSGCASEWRCESADYPRIARWLPGCAYTGAVRP